MDNYTLKIESRIGGRQENQDSFGSQDTPFGLLIVVCDGMGGAKGGKAASTLAVSTITSEILNSEASSSAEEVLNNAIKKANEIVYAKSISTSELQGMGTTVVAILIDENCATTAHVGDSRIYQVRDKRKVFRTFDHSMVFELVRRGRITEEQARLSAESNVILRALGTKPDVDVEINSNILYRKGDRFLLCSDGVCGAVTETEICRLIKTDKSVERTVGIIAETIDNIGINSGGKHDNLTAALVELNLNSKIKGKMDRKLKVIISTLVALLVVSCVFNGISFVQKRKVEKRRIEIQNELNKIDSIVVKVDSIKVDKSSMDSSIHNIRELIK